jgi:hypothetical protein
MFRKMKYNFEIKGTKEKIPFTYKSLYIKEALVKEINKIAKDNHTSFNNVVISMIEHCLNENKTK